MLVFPWSLGCLREDRSAPDSGGVTVDAQVSTVGGNYMLPKEYGLIVCSPNLLFIIFCLFQAPQSRSNACMVLA